MPRARSLILALLATGVAVAGRPAPSGSAQAPPPPTIQSAPGAPQAGSAAFSAETVYVRVPVRVFDKRGAFITDLGREQLELKDEGVLQTIDSLTLVMLPRPGSAGVVPAERGASSVALRVLSGRRLVIVLDDLHLTARRASVVKQVIGRFIQAQDPSTTRVALLTTSGVPPQVDFTADLRAVVEALQQLGGQKLQSATIGRMGRSATLDGDDRTDPDVRERATKARKSFAEIRRIAEALGDSGHEQTALLLVSEGPDYDTSDLLSKNPSDASGVLATFALAVQACADRGIPIYAVDPKGLVLPEGDILETSGIFGNAENLSLRNETWSASTTLRDLASMTGGHAVIGHNDLDKALRRIDGDLSAYYLVGFAPSSPRGKRFHKLKVTVHRPGMRVAARAGYLRW
jgi:VWFA-related protein